MATSFLVVQNRAFSKLAAAVNNSTTTFTVTAAEGANFPSTYPFHLTIEDEIVSCTNRSTDIMTVVRARQGTSAVTHPNKAYVALNITAKSVTDLNTALNTVEDAYIAKALFDAHTIIIAISDDTPVKLDVAASRIVGRKSSGNIGALTAAEILAILTGQAGAAFDWNNQNLNNIKTINLTSGAELTIASGVVTATQGHHSIDTEGDAPTDDLDTINGLSSNDLLFIYAASGARTIRIRNGVGNIFLRHQIEAKSYNFNSPSGSSGTFYVAGFYDWSATDANLTQSSLTVNNGSANVSKAAHAGLVAGGAGTVDTGVISIVVSGTSIDDEGNRATSDSETLVADITAMSLNQFFSTTKKWLGQVTYTLTTVSGSPVNFNADFNYGFCKYEDFGNQDFTVTDLECVGLAGGTDSGFNIKLYYHSSTGWTYAATGFVPGGTVLANMNTDHSTEKNLVSGEPFAYKRTDLNTDIGGNDSEGLVVEITTSANRAVEAMDIHIGVHTIPKYFYLGAATQHTQFMKHGSNWLQV